MFLNMDILYKEKTRMRKTTKSEINFVDVYERTIENTCENTVCHQQIRVKFNHITKDLEKINDYSKIISGIYEKNTPFTILYDVSDITSISHEFIKQQSSFMFDNYETTKSLMMKCAVLVKTPAVKVAINALFALKKPPCENYKVFVYSVTNQIKACSYIRYNTNKYSIDAVTNGCSRLPI